jgi:hypothetical protein
MLLSLLERLAARRRRPGAHPVWTAAAFGAWLLRRYRKRVAQDQVALREVLRPGETLVITHTTDRQG